LEDKCKKDRNRLLKKLDHDYNRNGKVVDCRRALWKDKPLDLNTATREQLTSLPGVTGVEADEVIAGRPYDSPDQLVTRRILPQSKYDKIADRLTAKK